MIGKARPPQRELPPTSAGGKISTQGPVDSSRGHAEACPRCGRPAAEGHACGKRAHQKAHDEPTRKPAETRQRLGSSPTLGAGGAAAEAGAAVGAALEERTPPPRAPLSGRTLGKNYRVLEPIGAGGMGVVYLVEHVKLKKRFAAKVLNAELAMNAEACARFEVEAHAVSQLEHDNIINVIDYGTSEEGLVFMVMEYLRGRTLQARIDQSPLTSDELLAVMVQVCHALGCAHEAGVVHRDMKPDNIFLNERMRNRPPLVKVLDFGISKARDVSLKDGRITKQGQVLGSPEYMSPEAARGDEVDARADIYAVGIILYELVTGKVPFRSENYLKVLQKHISERPAPPRQVVPDLAEPMQRLILRALAKHPDGRQQNMAELEAELIEAMPEEAARVLNPRHGPSSGSWLLTPPIGVPATPLRAGSEPQFSAAEQVTPMALDDTSPPPTAPTPDTAAAPTPAPAAAPVTAVSDAPPAALAEPSRSRPSRRRVLLTAGVATAVALLLAVIVLRLLGGREPDRREAAGPAAPSPPPAATSQPSAAPAPTPPVQPPAPTPPVEPPAPVPPPTVAKIPFRIETTPHGASVYLNGKLVGKTPLAIQVGRGRKPGQLKIALRDYATVARKVDLSRPVDLKLALERSAAIQSDAGPKNLELRQNR